MCQPRKWWVGLLPLLALWLALNWLETPRIEGAVSGAAGQALMATTGDAGFSTASGRDVSLNGWIFDEATRPAALAAAAGAAGVRLTSDGLTPPPPQNPYLFRAALQDGVLTLSGAISSPAERAAIIAAAKGAAPNAQIVDQLGYYSGAPQNFSAGVVTALGALSHLSTGDAQLRGAELSLRGQAADAAEYQAAMAEMKRLPEGIKLVDSAIAPPKAQVFSFQAENDGSRLMFSGFVASEAQRAALLSQAQKLFPDMPVVDRLQVASGAPEKFAYDAAFALRMLAQLKSGKASLVGGKTTLSGEARPGQDAAAVAVAGGPGAALDLAGVKPGDSPPFVMGAEKSASALTLTGFYADEDSRQKILEAAKGNFPGLPVIDRMARAVVAPKSATTAAIYGLEQLARLRVGAFGLSDGKATLSGDAGDADAADQVKTRFIAAMPDGYSVDTQLTGAAREPPATATETPAPNSAAPASASSSPASPSVDAKDCQARLTGLVRATPIQFEFGSAALKPDSTGVLDQLSAAAKTCPSVSFVVSGHTDDIGLVSHNRDLSRRRALAVVDYLSQAGVDAKRLTAVGYGESRPLAPNDTDEDRAKNRRIEFDLK